MTGRGTVFYLGSLESRALASCASREHRTALVDDLNRLSGPPSPRMSGLQQEFIEERMEPVETVAFATMCYGLLSAAVSGAQAGMAATLVPDSAPDSPPDSAPDSAPAGALPGYNALFFSVSIPIDIMEVKSIGRRQDLVDRYNDALGPPGKEVSALQSAFLTGELERARVARYIQQCEEMIEARHSLRHNRFI